MDEFKKKQNEDVLAGCNCVREALRAGRPIDTLLVARGERSGGAPAVIALCREKGI
ncbi:MAG: 23S rRNA (guanosine(2251)-2'-O)-methyltransferase RlmB, partial [Clostridiales bacterium]|nr:23S rRNA (guanosine(2251)-2'-O)-methyltransferase RlmB [Clostridiales bacterium]